MPWLTDLDVVLRNNNIGCWADPGWKTRGHGPMSGVRAIIIHHTAGGGSNDWRVVRDGRAGLAGPLAHMTFERDGGVRLLAAGQSWHAGTGSHPLVGRNNGNAWCIGIEGVSKGVGNDWTAAQRREYPRVAAALCRHYRLPADAVIGHKEWAPTRKIDPGDWDMNAFRADVRRHLGGAAPAPAPAPEVPDLDANQHRMLTEIHRELTQRLPRRITEDADYRDTVMGFAINADSFGYRANQALDRIEKVINGLAGPIPRAGAGMEGETSLRSMAAWNDATHAKQLADIRADLASLRALIEQKPA